jgi:hypothetical protein
MQRMSKDVQGSPCYVTENRSVGGSIPPLGTIKINKLRLSAKGVSTLFSANVDNFDCYVFPVKSSCQAPAALGEKRQPSPNNAGPC